jgi:hypothetical protein
MKTVPLGGPCRNFRAKPEAPDLTDGTVKRIPLIGGLYAYVDAANYEWLSQYNWTLVSGGYAGRMEKGKCILMHRQITRARKGKVVDHIDGTRLNNCTWNLRVCTHPENHRNSAKHRGSTSRFKGVYYKKERGVWYAYIQLNHKRYWLGYFTDEVEAARAYDRRAVELGIEYARLNFPEEWPPERRQEAHAQWQKENGKRNGKRRKARAASVKRHAKPPAGKPHNRLTCKAKRTARRARRKAFDL